MRVKSLVVKDVDFIPQNLEEGILYVAEHYRIAVHSCCCGCGMEVATPLGIGQFKLTRDEGGPTLYPSIGNHDYPCKSHYWIERGEVTDSGPMARGEILRNRRVDRAEKMKRRQMPAEQHVPSGRQIPTGCLSLFPFGLFRK